METWWGRTLSSDFSFRYLKLARYHTLHDLSIFYRRLDESVAQNYRLQRNFGPFSDSRLSTASIRKSGAFSEANAPATPSVLTRAYALETRRPSCRRPLHRS